MTRKYQKIHSYTFDHHEDGTCRVDDKIHTERSSFLTLENAINDAKWWIAKPESWMDTTVVEITIIDKETKEVLWHYEA